MLQSYTQCLGTQHDITKRVKSIVNTDFVVEMRNVHAFRYSSGKYAVDGHCQRQGG